MAKRIEPFVGPRPFEREDEKYFFGRTQVASELVSLILAHSTVVLYAQSGAGKTSLLKAKVLSALEEQHGFDVLPMARVQGRAAADEAPGVANIYVAHALRDLSNNSLTPEECGRLTFAEYLAARPRPSRPDEEFDEDDDEETRARAAANRPRVVIFDQFEELFTLYPEHYEARRKFFEQLQQALEQDSLLRVVFSMREDYIAELDPYVHLIPDSMRIRFRMERLRKKAALEAVVGPLKSYNQEHGKKGAGEGLRFEQGVAEKLVDDLRTVKLHSGAKEIEFKGEFIEPVHLQIVCKAILEKMLAEGHEVITQKDLESFGNVNQALTEYFERAIAKAARAANINEGSLRRWFDRVLITPENTRSTVLRGGTETAGIPNQAIDVLAGERLIRSETRDNRAWYELSHDKLIGPIRESYQRWLLNQPAEEQARTRYIERANRWLASRRKDNSLLLSRAEVGEAWRWANPEGQGYDESLAALVEASQASLDREAARAREVRRLRFVAVVLGLMMLLSVVTTVYAFRQSVSARRERAQAIEARDEATRQRTIAQQKKDEANASSLKAAEQARIALAKSKEAEEQRTKAEKQSQEADKQRQLAQEQEGLAERQAVAAREAERRAASAAEAEKIQRDKAVLASTEAEKQKRLALSSTAAASSELMIAQQPNQIRESVKRALGSLALDPDSFEGAQALRRGLALLPRLAQQIELKPAQLSFTADGDIAAIASDQVVLFDKEGTSKHELKRTKPQGVSDNIISADGRYMAQVASHEARIVSLTDPNENIAPIIYDKGHDANGREVRATSLFQPVLSPDGRYLAGMMLPNRLRAWETKTGRSVLDVEMGEESRNVRRPSELDLTFSQDGNAIKVSRGLSVISIYRIEEGARLLTFSRPEPVVWFALSPRARYLAVLEEVKDKGKVIRVLDVSNGQETISWRAPNSVERLVFSPDESNIAVRGGTTVTVWDIKSGQEITRASHTVDVRGIYFSPSGNLMATTAADRTTRLWNARDGRELFRMGHNDEVSTVSFSPDEKYLVTGSDDIRLWDISREGQDLDFSQDAPVSDALLSHNGSYLAVLCEKVPELEPAPEAGMGVLLREIKILETLTGREVARLPIDTYGLRAAFSPDDKLLFIVGTRKVRAWEFDGRRFTRDYDLNSSIKAVAFSQDGSYAALMLHDRRSVILMDLSGNRTVNETALPEEPSSGSVAVSDDGKRVVFTPESSSARLFIWETTTNKTTQLPKSSRQVTKTRLSSDGQYLAYADEKSWHVYDINQGSYIFDDVFGESGIEAVTFSPDSRYIALSGSKGNEIHIYSLFSRQLVLSPITSNNSGKITFNRDGSYFAFDDGGFVRVWSVLRDQEFTRIGYNGSLRAMAFTPDDKYIVTGSTDRFVRVALLQVEDLMVIACKRAGGITEDEWTKYFEGEKYQPVCRDAQ